MGCRHSRTVVVRCGGGLALRRVNWVSTCILFLSYPFYPHLMQRFFAAKSPRDLKVAISFSCVEPYIRILGVLMVAQGLVHSSTIN